MQSSNILILLCTKPHTSTRHVSCRLNSEMRLWPYVNCTKEEKKKIGRSEWNKANNVYDAVALYNELEPKYENTRSERKKKEWHFLVVVVSLYFGVNCLRKY